MRSRSLFEDACNEIERLLTDGPTPWTKIVDHTMDATYCSRLTVVKAIRDMRNQSLIYKSGMGRKAMYFWNTLGIAMPQQTKEDVRSNVRSCIREFLMNNPGFKGKNILIKEICKIYSLTPGVVERELYRSEMDGFIDDGGFSHKYVYSWNDAPIKKAKNKEEAEEHEAPNIREKRSPIGWIFQELSIG